MALEGYKELFNNWLPYYRQVKAAPFALQKTLLHIMSSLDDTCVLHRAGAEGARKVNETAQALLEAFSEEKLQGLCTRYAAEGVSPGGAADMLALTLFADSLIQ